MHFDRNGHQRGLYHDVPGSWRPVALADAAALVIQLRNAGALADAAALVSQWRNAVALADAAALVIQLRNVVRENARRVTFTFAYIFIIFISLAFLLAATIFGAP